MRPESPRHYHRAWPRSGAARGSHATCQARARFPVRSADRHHAWRRSSPGERTDRHCPAAGAGTCSNQLDIINPNVELLILTKNTPAVRVGLHNQPSSLGLRLMDPEAAAYIAGSARRAFVSYRAFVSNWPSACSRTVYGPVRLHAQVCDRRDQSALRAGPGRTAAAASSPSLPSLPSLPILARLRTLPDRAWLCPA